MTRVSRYLSLTAATALLCAACAEEPRPERIRPVLSVVVGDATSLVDRRFPGRAKATQEVDMAFEVAGQLVERPVDVGTEVEQGDLLARLDPRDFENLLRRARAERERAEAHYERLEQAARSGAVSQQEVTDARARLDQAEAQVRIREKALEDSVLTAPFKGTISSTYLENYQNVRAKQAVMRLLDTSRLEMEISIPESLISLSPYVRGTHITFDVFPDHTIRAEIKEVSNEASRITRTYPVTLIFDPPADIDIKPGMAGEAHSAIFDLPPDLREEGLEVPAAAVFTDEGTDSQQSYVWLVDESDATVHRQEVSPIRFTPRGVLVQGLESGQRVATAGVHYLREGQQVRIAE